MATKKKFENTKYSSSNYIIANQFSWKNFEGEEIKKKIIYFSGFKKIM